MRPRAVGLALTDGDGAIQATWVAVAPSETVMECVAALTEAGSSDAAAQRPLTAAAHP